MKTRSVRFGVIASPDITISISSFSSASISSPKGMMRRSSFTCMAPASRRARSTSKTHGASLFSYHAERRLVARHAHAQLLEIDDALQCISCPDRGREQGRYGEGAKRDRA